MLNSVRGVEDASGDWEHEARNIAPAISANLLDLLINPIMIRSPFASQHHRRRGSCPSGILHYRKKIIPDGDGGLRDLDRYDSVSPFGYAARGRHSRIFSNTVRKYRMIRGTALNFGSSLHSGSSRCGSLGQGRAEQPAKKRQLCGATCYGFILSKCKIITLDAFRNIHTVSVTAF